MVLSARIARRGRLIMGVLWYSNDKSTTSDDVFTRYTMRRFSSHCNEEYGMTVKFLSCIVVTPCSDHNCTLAVVLVVW